MLTTQYSMVPSEAHFVDGGGRRDTRAATAVTRMLCVMRQRPSFATYRDTLPRLGVDGSSAFVTDFESDPTLAAARDEVQATTGTCLESSAEGPMLKAQALAGHVEAKSGWRFAVALTVDDSGVLAGVDDVLPVFQNQGRISEILWTLH